MANEIGTAYVGIEFDKSGVENQLQGLGGGLQSKFGSMGNLLGSSMKAGLVGAAAGAAVAVGKYLYDIGADFDAMADGITVATGATGKELDGLVGMAKKIGTELPVSFEDAGTAVGQLASKTGLAGKPLKDLSTQVLALSKITDQDLGATIESSTRLLGDWGLKGRDAAGGLDTLFKASQETGVETGRLGELMTKFGGPFRQLGFGFTESAALLGKWQKEGVNTELVAGSMRIALGKFAKAGREPGQAFKETIAEIQKLGPGAEATGLAIKTFGARAGPDMAAAVLEGRFAIGDLVADINKSKSTIKGAEKGTRDFSEQWLIFKNQVAVAVAPLAERMFSAIGQGMAILSKELPPVIAMLKSEFGPAFQDIGVAIEEFAAAIQELRPVFDAVFPIIAAYIKQQVAAIKLIAEVVSGVVQLVAALLRGDWSAAWEAAQKIVGAFATYFKTTFENVKAYLGAVLSIFSTLAKAIGTAIMDGVMAGVKPLVGLVTGVFTTVTGAIRTAVSTVTSAAKAVGEAIKTGVMTPVNLVAGLVRAGFNAVVSAIRGVLGAAKSAANAVGDAILNGIRSGVSTIGSVVSTALGKVQSAITTTAGQAAGWAKSIGTAIVSGVISGLAGLFDQVKDKIVGGVKGAVDWAKGHLGSTAEEYAAANLGAPIMDGAVKGVVAGSAELASGLSQAVKTAVDAGRQEIEAARGMMSESFGRMAGDALAAFDAIASGVQTKHEKMIAGVEARRAEADRKAALSAAQTALTEAKATGDPAAIASAEKAVEDAKWAIKKVAWERDAAEERKQLDARTARRRRNFEDELADLQANLAKTGASSKKAQAEMVELFDKFGVDYKKSGKALGNAFGDTMRDSVAAAARDIRRILDELLEAIREVQRASAKAVAEAPGKGKAAPAALAPATATAGAMALTPTPYAGGGGGLAGPVPLGQRLRAVARAVQAPRIELGGAEPGFEVRVYIGETELRGMVRSEVVSIDTGIARTLLAGGRTR